MTTREQDNLFRHLIATKATGRRLFFFVPVLAIIFSMLFFQTARADFTIAYSLTGNDFYKQPAAAENQQSGDFLTAYLDPTLCTGPSTDWEVRATLRNATGGIKTQGLAPLGACNHRAVGRPAVSYSPQSDVFCVAAPTTPRPSGMMSVMVGFVKGDGTLVEPFSVQYAISADSYYEGFSGHGSLQVVHNSLRNEFVVTVQVVQSGSKRIWAQRISPSGNKIGSVVELMNVGTSGILSHGIAYAPVTGTYPSGGRYLFVSGGGGVKLLDADLNPILVTCHLNQQINQTVCDGEYINLWYGDDESAGNSDSGESRYFDVAYGEVEGLERFLIVYTDTNNVTPGIGIDIEHSGVWGIFVDPQRLQYNLNTTQDVIRTYPTPFPLTYIWEHLNVDSRWKPRVSYSPAAQAFAVVWKETPTLNPANEADERYSHIRGVWVDRYVEDGQYGTDVRPYGYPPENLVISDVVPGIDCVGTTPYETCESYEDPDFPDVISVGGGTAAAIWDAMFDPPPTGWPPPVIDLPPGHSIRGDLMPVLPPPPNDDQVNAQIVSTGQYNGTLIRATNDGSGTCGSSADSLDVWYKFQADVPGTLFVSTCGTHDYFEEDKGVDTVLSLHSTTDGSQLPGLCNDDWQYGNYASACTLSDNGQLRDSALQYGMSTDQAVLIRVAPYNVSRTGPILLKVGFEATPDLDGDGYTVDQGDCDDNDNTVYPGAPELCDGKDNDCNPATADGSGESWYGTACDGPDTDLCKEGILTCSGGQQTCSDNTEDNIETCDGVDNDCNPATADGSGESWYGTATNCGTGECERVGQLTCSGGIQTDTCVPGQSSEEVCDGKDNDCDGLTDEDGVCDNTPAGQDIHVEDEWHQASVTFDSVLQGGDTTFATGPCGGSVWEGFTLIPADNPMCVEIETTAVFEGSVMVCMNYDDTGLTLDQEQKLVMIHCNDQGKCGMIPCNPPKPVDTVNNVVCGCTDTFSIFGVGFWEGCNADLDYDGVVDGKDLSDFVNAYGTASGHPAFMPHADFDGSGTIDAGDIPAMGRGLGADNCPMP